MNKYDMWGWDQQIEYENDLKIVYELETDSGFENEYPEETAKGTGLYGELTEEAVEHMISEYGDYFTNPNGVFYDMGSGTGKVVSHVALGTQLSKVCGVELDKVRFAKSTKLVSRLSFPFCTPELIHGDFFEQDYSDATVMYFDNTMWHEYFVENKKHVETLFETIKPGTLILTKEQMPHVYGHHKHAALPTSYEWTPGYSLIFLGINP
jgi:hypothetical protein|tara:strand:- start:62 stop:688 length:627 start_codon:yes stop_codon:yes gene_type:complete